MVWDNTVDRARELYQAATREKVKLIKMWREKLEDVGMANEAERGERGRWLGEMSGLAVRLREDLQVSGADTIGRVVLWCDEKLILELYLCVSRAYSTSLGDRWRNMGSKRRAWWNRCRILR